MLLIGGLWSVHLKLAISRGMVGMPGLELHGSRFKNHGGQLIPTMAKCLDQNTEFQSEYLGDQVLDPQHTKTQVQSLAHIHPTQVIHSSTLEAKQALGLQHTNTFI